MENRPPSIMDNRDRKSVRESVTAQPVPHPRPRYTFVETDMASLRSITRSDSDFSFLQNDDEADFDDQINMVPQHTSHQVVPAVVPYHIYKNKAGSDQSWATLYSQQAPTSSSSSSTASPNNTSLPGSLGDSDGHGSNMEKGLVPMKSPSPMPGTMGPARSSKKRKVCIIAGITAIVLAIAAAVLVPVGLLVIDKKVKAGSSGAAQNSTGSTANAPAQSIPASAKGTILDVSTWLNTTDFNTTYTNETVGGLTIMGLNSTWDDSAQPNSGVPPINQPFPYGSLPIRGVNVGGWLVLEPFITPSYFSNSSSNPVVDEWTLFGSLNQSGGIANVKNVLETHYMNFVTEDTFREISEAGLDHVRIPYGYWAIKTFPGDQYLPQVSWRYLLRGIEWARKYGLRVDLDLHSVPGSQNGWNHSGRQGLVGWLNGTDGTIYGDESLDLHRQLGAFFSQDRYKNLVTFYGLVNEPRMQNLDVAVVNNWTSNAYRIVRDAGYANNIVFGDGFIGEQAWKDVFPAETYPNMTLDIHQYTIFNTGTLAMSHTAKLNFVCDQWAQSMNQSSNPATGHGPTMIGEWSQADNDCALNLNNVGVGSRWEGTFSPGYGTPAVLQPTCATAPNCTCDPSNSDPSNYSDEYKQFLLQFAELQMEVFESGGGWGSMYWTWDAEDSTSSQWSYKKGRAAGILPQVAYQRNFTCAGTLPDYLVLGLPESY
jgi:glucan 1,3-beta-glucosidase